MFREGIRLALIGLAVWTAVMLGQDAPKKLSKSEAATAIVSKVTPEYPALARQLKIEGTVDLEALVSEQGAVEDVKIVSGNPMLTKSAVEAVKKWKFAPSTESGKAVKALVPITLNFKRAE